MLRVFASPFFLLRQELALWQRAERQAVFWIRDDDATRMSPEFDKLLKINKKYSLPMAISVIPKWAGLRLPKVLSEHPDIVVLQHGWSHENHAQPNVGHSEFPDNRPPKAVMQDLLMGRMRLEKLYGEQFLHGFVPPWNHIADVHKPLLKDYAFLSTQETGLAAPGHLPMLPIHVDVLRWSPYPRFRGKGKIIRKVCQELRLRREQGSDAPIGVQLHHLVMDDASWRFTDQLLGVLAEHPAIAFLDVRKADFLTCPAVVPLQTENIKDFDENILAFRQKIA